MHTWPVSNPTHAAAAALFPLQLQFPVLLESGMFCCFFSPDVLLFSLVHFLRLKSLMATCCWQFILETCTFGIWELTFLCL